MLHRIWNVALPLVIAMILASWADADQAPFEQVKGWLDANELKYATTEKNEIVLAFEGDTISRVDIIVGFSEAFIHLSVPVGGIPANPGADYYAKLIELTGSIPMIKPYIDKERFLYVVIDFPLAGISEQEVVDDIALLVEFADMHSGELYPWKEE